MSDQSSGEKTEKATPKRLNDARNKGQVVRSRDLVATATLLATTLLMARMGGFGLSHLTARLSAGITRIGDHPRTTITAADLGTLAAGDFLFFAMIVGPVLFTAVVVAVAANVAQAGWVLTAEPLKFKFSRLSPSNGLQRLKPSQSGLDLLKTVINVTMVVTLALSVGRDAVHDSTRLAMLRPADAALAAWEHVLQLLWRCGFALLAIGGADYGVQFWRTRSSLKMSKQELKDESKQQEGNPMIKARIKRVQREMHKRRMLSSVKTATVVITNPTHYAVALKYTRGAMAAPVIVAKGKDLLAQRIKAIAREHGVPTVENVSLAQALFKGADVGDAIPAQLFGAVAEVLAYLVRIKQLML